LAKKVHKPPKTLETIEDLNAAFLSDLEDRHGTSLADAVTTADQTRAVERVLTMSPMLDYVCGPLPRRRYVEFYGEESTGKTTLALLVASSIMRQGTYEYEPGKERPTRALYIDAEGTLDPDYVKALQFDPTRMLVVQPGTGEEALNVIRAALQLPRSQQFDLIVIDSWAALPSAAEYEGSMDDNQMAAQARMQSKFFRVISGDLPHTDTMMIGINQVRTNPQLFKGVSYGTPWKPTGSKGLQFYSSVTIQTLDGGNVLDAAGNVVGVLIRYKNRKNKTAPRWRESDKKASGKDGFFGTFIRFDSREGIVTDYVAELIEAASRVGVFLNRDGEVAPNWKSTFFVKAPNGELIELGQGFENVVNAMNNDPGLLKHVHERFYERLKATLVGREAEDDDIAVADTDDA